MKTTEQSPLRTALDEDGRRQEWLATKLGVAPHTVWSWCAGRTRPAPKHRVAIEKLIGLSRTVWLTEEERGGEPLLTA